MSHRPLSGIAIVAVIALAALAACNTSKTPTALGPETQVNFYSASLGLVSAPCATPPTCTSYNAIYYDRYDTTRTDHPYFFGTTVGLDYPVDPLQPIPGVPPFERPLYFRLPAGTHRFWFANGAGTVVADTALPLGASRRTLLYFVDSLATNYRVLTLDETTTGPSSGVRFRVLNLSPDAGPVGVYALGDSGQNVWSNLPQQVAYGTVTPYVTLDSALTLTDGNVYLEFFSGIDTANTIATAVVPYLSGRSYHVVVEGTVTQETLNYPNPTQPGQFTPVTVNPTIAAKLRAVY
jgi:hypothetical protein